MNSADVWNVSLSQIPYFLQKNLINDDILEVWTIPRGRRLNNDNWMEFYHLKNICPDQKCEFSVLEQQIPNVQDKNSVCLFNVE